MFEGYREFLRGLSGAPGVYRMQDEAGTVLYVGKARNLHRRVSSYFRKTGSTPKVQALMSQVTHIDVTVTHTENEALLLEHNLIKTLRPRYNVLLRDDKSYPYIFLSNRDRAPRITFHRGGRSRAGRYFGPFPSTTAVRESLSLLQKVFRLRTCEDSVFQNRTRPCLQYQIERCSAPCVGYIETQAYGEDVRQAVMFLEGRNFSLVEELGAAMEHASTTHAFEQAAILRDRIAALRQVQERQYVSADGGEADVLAVVMDAGVACVTLMCIRSGRNLGSKSFFPTMGLADSENEVLEQFLAQHYLAYAPPAEICLDRTPPGRRLIQEVLTSQAGYRVGLTVPVRGIKQKWVVMATVNAQDELRRRLSARATLEDRLEGLRGVLGLTKLDRIECFDISHTQGEETMASCVAFDAGGPIKADYRRYRIEHIGPGDDYAAIAQAVGRRYASAHAEPAKVPDLVLIDGGRGQLNAALGAARAAGFTGALFAGVAKGPDRRPGEEEIILPSMPNALRLSASDPALHLVQSVRDEAHRFAITGHRNRRDKKRVTSALEELPGIGEKRRQALLRHLGGLPLVARAGVEDLMKVPGISPTLARRIYEAFHDTTSVSVTNT